MMLILLRLVCLIIGYGFGLIQAGFLLGKIHNIDIRKEGSGNSGTTNAMRVLGVRVGLLTFLIDTVKCVAAILLVRAFWGGNESFMLLAIYTGLGVTLGHNFPYYMNFKGGKGIAAMSGLVIMIGVLTSPWIIIVPAFAFFSCAILTRYISLGSLQVSVLFIFMMVFYGQMGGFEGLSDGNRIELYIVVIILAALAWYRHLDNIKRLLKGEESRFGSKKEEEVQMNEVDEPDKLRSLSNSRIPATRFTSTTYSRDFRRTHLDDKDNEDSKDNKNSKDIVESRINQLMVNIKEKFRELKDRFRRK